MASKSDYENAAKKLPSNRSVGEQALVDKAYSVGMTNVKNLDHAAKRYEKVHGK